MWLDLFNKKQEFADRVAVEALATDDREIVLAKIVGPQQSVRRMWAHLVQGRPERKPTTTNLWLADGDQKLQVWVDPLVRYKADGDDFGGRAASKQSRKADAPALRTVFILRESLTQLSREELVGLGDEVPRHFVGTLRAKCAVPFRDEWVPEMWRLGLEARLITALGANPHCEWVFGPLTLYKIAWHTERWHREVIRPLLAARRQA
jgi:hypothetical protein